MATALDTNILVSLWDKDESLNEAANYALADAVSRGEIVICGAVFAELLALPGRTSGFIDRFVEESQIRVDWKIDEATWRSAGNGFANYAKKRRRNGSGLPGRTLADFVVGAHALENRCSLLTLDKRTYKAAFPGLKVISI